MKKVLAILLALTMMFTFVACSSAPATDDTGAATEGGETLDAEGIFKATGKNPYSDEIKIGWIPTDAPAANCTAWGGGMEKELSYWPNVTFNEFDGKRDAELQSSIMRDLIAQEYDAIILQPYNSATLAVAVEEAEAAGIPVITINIDADAPHAALVAMTDYEAGYAIGVQMAEDAGGEGGFVIIQATPGASRGELLEEGFLAALEAYPDITILDAQTGEWNSEKANVVMTNFLTKYDQIDGVFAHNDQMAEGAATAVQTAGRLGEMSIWGANGEAKALEYIEDGLMTGTIYTNCYDQGATAARLAMMYVGGNIDTAQFTETLVIKMPPIAVTADNVATITEDMRW